MEHQPKNENLLPTPLAVLLAQIVSPKIDDGGRAILSPTADDEVSGNTTYTDD